MAHTAHMAWTSPVGRALGGRPTGRPPLGPRAVLSARVGRT